LSKPHGIRLGQPTNHFVGDYSLLFNLEGALPDRGQQRVNSEQEGICKPLNGRIAPMTVVPGPLRRHSSADVAQVRW
jgi:hypothetical protein